MGFQTQRSCRPGAVLKRAAVPSEVQAAELRGRARRRLAGAIALVLAAVIVLPMVLDSQPVPVADNIPIKVPERNTPFQPQVSEPQVAPPVASAQGAGRRPAPRRRIHGNHPNAAAGGLGAAARDDGPAASAARRHHADDVGRGATVQAGPKPAAKPDPKPDPKPAAKPETRTDDGARALALLEGRSACRHAARRKAGRDQGQFRIAGRRVHHVR